MAILRSLSKLSPTLLARSLHASKSNFRYFSSQVQEPKATDTSPRLYHQHYRYVPLSNRVIIRVSGVESVDYLQGLITNDVRLLLDTNYPRNCIYAFMMSNVGKIEADMFIYRFPQRPDQLLVEVDEAVAPNIHKLMTRYKIRRKVNIKYDREALLTAIYPESPEAAENLPLESSTVPDDYLLVPDPRSNHFGYRLIATGGKDLLPNLSSILTEQNESFNSVSLETADLQMYRKFRYQLGVGEGVLDFPQQSVFPFEANAELLNAVSFSKGCYVGQELTARTYHTGVIRKRYVPIELLGDESTFDEGGFPTQNVIIEGEEGTTPRIMGRFRANLGKSGIAALKYVELFSRPDESSPQAEGDGQVPSTIKQGVMKLSNSGIALRTWRPWWWPDNI